VEVAPTGTTAKHVTQELFFVAKESKLQLLEKVLGEYRGSVLVFSRTKHGAKKIARVVRNMGHTSTEIHSNRSLNQRLEALSGFKLGKYRVMIATDIAARGIDVSGIELVVNYDLPENPEDYVHRIGRTARAGHQGHAISFATPDQTWDVRGIEKLIKTKLPVSNLPQLPEKRQVLREEPVFENRTPRPPRRPNKFQRPFSNHPRTPRTGRFFQRKHNSPHY
jgi:ATP-dependent RNA helicase RhlE